MITTLWHPEIARYNIIFDGDSDFKRKKKKKRKSTFIVVNVIKRKYLCYYPLMF